MHLQHARIRRNHSRNDGSLEAAGRDYDVVGLDGAGRGFEAEAWWGLLAPVNTPAAIVTRMHAEVTKALRAPAMRQQFDQQALTVTASSPEELQKFLINEVERWARVVRDNKIKAGE